MNVNGVWKVEMLGLYGWEPIVTAFLQDGDYKSGAAEHYSTGKYKVSGKKIKISADTVQHGKVRTAFGKSEKKLTLKLKGEIDGNLINGSAHDSQSAHKIAFKMTRLADLS